MSLATTITALRTVIDTIPDLRVYADPPESINEFPSAIVYALSGTYEMGSATLARSYHTLIIELYLNRQVLMQAVDNAKAWPPLVFDAINTAMLAGSLYVVETGGKAAFSYRLGPLEYNKIEHFGVRFTVRLKEML